MSYKRKGFTLIELLVVIAIIGILAAALLVSLGGARKTARDARRAADLRNVQNALELYNSNNGAYPNGNTWAAMSSAITGMASLGISQIPIDPSIANNYKYCPSSTGQAYAIKATLEANNLTLLGNDLDGPQPASPATTGGDCPLACGDNPEVSPNWFYCLGI